jgi:hypothetical protein
MLAVFDQPRFKLETMPAIFTFKALFSLVLFPVAFHLAF